MVNGSIKTNLLYTHADTQVCDMFEFRDKYEWIIMFSIRVDKKIQNFFLWIFEFFILFYKAFYMNFRFFTELEMLLAGFSYLVE